MIPGVKEIELTTHIDDRGYFREVLKSPQIEKFGQWSVSYMHHNVVKAWHCHKIQYDYWYIVCGVVKAVLCDLRPIIFDLEFPNLGDCKWGRNKVFDEYLLGDNQSPKVLVIPPGVAHGLKVLQGPAVLMYITSEEYDPQDEGRIPFDSLGYGWFKQDIK